MKINPKQYAVLLYEMTKDVTKGELKEATRSFLQLLVKGRVLPMLPRILQLYADYYNRKENVVDVEVTTAHEVSKKTIHEIQKVAAGFQPASRSLKAAATIEIEEKMKPSVLGGARIRVGDYMIDDTLKARLTRLKMELSYGR